MENQDVAMSIPFTTGEKALNSSVRWPVHSASCLEICPSLNYNNLLVRLSVG